MLLEYTWGDDVLRWQLEPTRRGTRLTLLHTMDDHAMLPKVAAGWHICLDVADQAMSGNPIRPHRRRRGQELRLGTPGPRIRETFGIANTGVPETIGR